MSLEGKQLGRYQLRRLLGSGGMGEVYLGEDPRISQQVAIKVIRAEVSSHSSTQEVTAATRLFQREATAIARLDHPRVLPLYDFGEAAIDGTKVTYLVTPFRPDGSFADWLQRRSGTEPLPLEDVAYFLAQMAEALQYVHDQHIIHRDVKPSNFLIRENKEHPSRPDLLLADFGVAQIVGTTAVSLSVRGTPNYMAPEQWEGHPVPATDQYALGIIAYELLTGQLVFQGSMQQMMYHHLNTRPQPPSQINHHIPPSVDAVLARALAKRPEERYPSVSVFAQALQQALLGREISLASTTGEADRQADTNCPVTQPEGAKPISQSRPEVSVAPGDTPGSWQFTMTMRPSDESVQLTDLQGIGQPLPPTAPAYLGQTPAQATPPEGQKPEQPSAPSMPQPTANPTPHFSPPAATPAFNWQYPSVPGTPTPPQRWGYPPASAGQASATPGGPITPPEWSYPPTPAGQAPSVPGGPTTPPPWSYPPTPSGQTPAQGLQAAPPSPPTGLSPLPPGGGKGRRPDWMRRVSTPMMVALVCLAVLIVGGIVLASVVLSRLSSPPAPRAWKTVIDDPLSDNSQGNGWNVNSGCKFSNNAYYVSSEDPHTISSCLLGTSFSNFSFQVQMTITQGDCGGIVFRRDSASGSGYFFEVCQNGTYTLSRSDSKTQNITPIIQTKTSRLIRHGLFRENSLYVKADGSLISLYINGQFVGSTSNDKTYSQGSIGVIASAHDIVPTIAGYTYAKVEVPPA